MQAFSPQSPADDALGRESKAFSSNHQQILRDRARNGRRSRLWTASLEGNDQPEYEDFIANLQIPCLNASRASFLLHDLNVTTPDTTPQRSRLKEIFQTGQHTIIINGAGTGKTRLLFEGLSTRWGLYLPCVSGPSAPGSLDLNTGLLQLSSLSARKDAPKAQTGDLDSRSAGILRRIFTQILLSRLTLFELYLRHAPLDDPNVRMRWLRFQLFPSAKLCYDMFDDFFRAISEHDASMEYLEGRIRDAIFGIRSLLGHDEPIYCVVDDAQRAHLQSLAGPGPTTALRQMLLVWESFDAMTFVLAGQPFDCSHFHNSGATPYRVWTDTGFFDGDEEQRRYVRRYLPPDLQSTQSTEKLLDRICLWLRGRYRITTYFIYCLLTTRFQNPHTLLTSYVRMYAGIQPEDGPIHTDYRLRSEYNRLVSGYSRYDPSQTLPRDVYAWSSAQMALHRLIALGQGSVIFTGDCSRPVSHRFAMFANSDGSEAIFCEPCIIFPLARLVFHRWGPSYGYLCTSVASALQDPPHEPPLHLASITLLLLALKGDRKLCDIFALAEPFPEWAQQTCKLVRLSRSEEANTIHAVPYETPFPGGRDQDPWATESPSWLRHDATEPFFVASECSRADLLFAVQLADGDVLFVALKIMLKNKHVDAPIENIELRLANMEPDRLFQVWSQSARIDNEDMLNSLSQVPTGAGLSLDLQTPIVGSGEPRVLRAFATFPDATDIGSLQQDTSSQPRAALKMDALQKLSEDIPWDATLRRIYSALIDRRKQLMVGDESVRVDVEGTIADTESEVSDDSDEGQEVAE
ncbi:uncharacterized protein SCHCODRAFT_02505094 [Schizophyllum commune H4-8]|nr:uncharacterized protein SCHCODRAFT_02505094 [Schizophyllum commune H4-8]KAI5891703.1 hypothetical protein SCHCODRAFT_02505094 [Schizophyllum commune H4-8]